MMTACARCLNGDDVVWQMEVRSRLAVSVANPSRPAGLLGFATLSGLA
jgi:hypothetical protein